MKYKFYVTDLIDGSVKGTNHLDTARNYASSEDYYVVEAETGLWLLSDGTTQEVEEAPPVNEEEGEG